MKKITLSGSNRETTTIVSCYILMMDDFQESLCAFFNTRCHYLGSAHYFTQVCCTSYNIMLHEE
jgi:hypothetical protein